MPVRPKQSITQRRLVIPIAGTSNFIPNIACMHACAKVKAAGPKSTKSFRIFCW